MEQLSIKTLFILCMSLFILVSCGETSNKSITDAVTESEVLGTNTPSGNISQIVHPGILNSDASLDFIDVDYNNNSYRQQAYGKINTMISSQISFPSNFPEIVYVRTRGDVTDSELQMWNDGLLAYGHALRWARTGNSSDATKAKDILNGWADPNHNFQIKICKDPANDPSSAAAGCPTNSNYYPMDGTQRRLQASWVAPNFAAAAEIIRRYNAHGGAGWSSNDAEDFEVFLELLYNDYIKTIANGIQQNEPRTGPPWSWSNNNWGASAVWAKMAIAAYTGKVNWFNDALTKTGYLIKNIIHSSTGEPTETDRDCLHPQMSLTALTYAAETAKIQGDHSLYGSFSGSTLEEGWEWMSDAYGTNDCNYRSSLDKIMPGVDVAYNYYGSNDIEDLRDQEEPYGIPKRQFIGFTTYTHYDVQAGQPATAVTTAIHKPTSNTQVSVGYEGESIAVNYNSGESLDNMLTKMKNAINSDQDIEITAEVNLSNNTITFIEKTPGSFANSNNVVLLFFTGDWQNGPGFSPSPTSMSGGTDS